MLYQKQERIWTSTEIIVSLPIRLCESILGDISSPTPGGVMIFMNSFIYLFSNKREKNPLLSSMRGKNTLSLK